MNKTLKSSGYPKEILFFKGGNIKNYSSPPHIITKDSILWISKACLEHSDKMF